jgi:hypothetical protein
MSECIHFESTLLACEHANHLQVLAGCESSITLKQIATLSTYEIATRSNYLFSSVNMSFLQYALMLHALLGGQ